MTLRFTRLTRPAVRKLQAGERITEHGITAEGLKDGDVRYSVNVMVDGQRVHRVRRPRPPLSTRCDPHRESLP